MRRRTNATLVIKNADGTSDRTFRVTGIADHLHSSEEVEQEIIFAKEEFEQALKKVSFKIN